MSLVSWAGSGMIHWKWDSPVKSSIGERASGWRRRDLEKNRIRAGDGLASQYNSEWTRQRTLSELSIHLPSEDVE